MTEHSRPAGVTSDIGPFAILPMWVLEAGVSGNAVRAYAILASYANRETGEAFPSRKTMAKRLGVSVDTIDRGIKELEEAQAVTVAYRYEDPSDEAAGRRQTTNGYIVRFARPPGGKSAEHPGRRSAQPRTRPASNQTTEEPKTRAGGAAAEYDPVKGRLVDGKNLPWEALAEATASYGAANGSRMTAALKSIRAEVWAELQERGVTLERAQRDPDEYERGLGVAVEARAGFLIREKPELTWGPEGIARWWSRAKALAGGTDDAERTAQEAVDMARLAL